MKSEVERKEKREKRPKSNGKNKICSNKFNKDNNWMVNSFVLVLVDGWYHFWMGSVCVCLCVSRSDSKIPKFIVNIVQLKELNI